MTRRFDVGIASYSNFRALKQTVDSIRARSTTDWRLLIVDNPSDDPNVRPWIKQEADTDERIVYKFMDKNVGYAGAVNEILNWAETEYIGYCDNDIIINTHGWDEEFCGLLDRHHEVGIVFPNVTAFPIHRGTYTEVMWGTGFCWAINRMAMKRTGLFDAEIGHQEEADYCLRIRMKGYRCACLPDVKVKHAATASTDPKSLERINAGVERWVNKWNKYFNGEQYHYHHPCVTRWEDWPPNALYLEGYYKKILGEDFNADCETVQLGGRKLDLIRVPRFFQMYRGRII